MSSKDDESNPGQTTPGQAPDETVPAALQLSEDDLNKLRDKAAREGISMTEAFLLSIPPNARFAHVAATGKTVPADAACTVHGKLSF